ncbi:winged helix-turn-helix transcriptional regulator [Prauserella oleivorans]|uniref:Winged helix-turn-helix transcriptional regulator n=1 Tax=Prauserella oleivorans TaxID=1478153 RepID=A0ABW5WCP3_9PSEU
MAGKRWYDDPCGVARALDMVGERWALLVVRELLLGPKRFTDLRAGLSTASQNVLTQRLRELEEAGIVRRRGLAPPASGTGYELTDRGRELEPVLLALARWGSRLPLTSEADLSADALMLALRTTFDAPAARGFHAVVELRLGVDRFRAEVSGDRLTLSRGEAPAPDAVIETDAATLRALVFGACPLGDAPVRVAGEVEVAERFLGLFPRPAPRQADAGSC